MEIELIATSRHPKLTAGTHYFAPALDAAADVGAFRRWAVFAADHDDAQQTYQTRDIDNGDQEQPKRDKRHYRRRDMTAEK